MKALKFDLMQVRWGQMLNTHETKSAWQLFKEHLIAIIDNHAPLKECAVRGRDCPWLDHNMEKATREREGFPFIKS